MKVTFDSNAWEGVLDGRDASCINVRGKISSGLIEPYMCEISLSLESIRKAARARFFETYSPSVTVSDVASADPKRIAARVSFGPNSAEHPGLSPQLVHKLVLANSLGFRVLRMTNFGTVRAMGIPHDMYVQFGSTDEFWNYAERIADCSTYIERLGCGSAEYMRYSSEYGLSRGRRIEIPDDDRGRFSRAVAEWCDGDALAAHFASGNDYFCTDDRARGAGRNSVFSDENFAKISEKYGVVRVTTNGLSAL